MIVSLIVAAGTNNAIGKDNQLLWHLPKDLQFFKQTTWAMPVVMGRKTFESIGRLLPGRRNVVISRSAPLNAKGAEWVTSLEQAFELLQQHDEVMVIGGAEIYRQCLPLAQRLYLTEIDLSTDGDAYFPDYQSEKADDWRLIDESHHPADTNNRYHCRFITLQRSV